MSETTPGQAAYEARLAAIRARLAAMGEDPADAAIGAAWCDLSPAERADEEAGAEAAIDESESTLPAQLAMAREAISDLADERDRYKATLERLADEDTPILGEGLGGGHREEHHVRANLARRSLGLDVDGCTECHVSLGLGEED